MKQQATIRMHRADEALRKVGMAMLGELGYQVLAAGAPGEASRLVASYPGEIHLLITDVVMPEMNGLELATRLAAIKPALKYLFISGYTADVIAHRGILEEEVQFIQKPFSLHDLAVQVHGALERS